MDYNGSQQEYTWSYLYSTAFWCFFETKGWKYLFVGFFYLGGWRQPWRPWITRGLRYGYGSTASWWFLETKGWTYLFMVVFYFKSAVKTVHAWFSFTPKKVWILYHPSHIILSGGYLPFCTQSKQKYSLLTAQELSSQLSSTSDPSCPHPLISGW